jgi:hypothetical protein
MLSGRQAFRLLDLRGGFNEKKHCDGLYFAAGRGSRADWLFFDRRNTPCLSKNMPSQTAAEATTATPLDESGRQRRCLMIRTRIPSKELPDWPTLLRKQ